MYHTAAWTVRNKYMLLTFCKYMCIKKPKWTLVCSTHIGTHSYWEDRYFSRCATLMTAPLWERFSAVEHMTVKGSVLSVSRWQWHARAGNWKLLKMMPKLEPRPRRALHSNIRCPAHGAMLVWWVTINPPPPPHAMSVSSWANAAAELFGRSVLAY